MSIFWNATAVIMEYDHIVRYHPTHLEQLAELKFGRVIRWFHKLLRYRTYVSTADRVSVTLAENLLIISLRAIDWHLHYKHVYSLSRILSYLFEGEQYVTFNIQQALQSVEYLTTSLDDSTIPMNTFDVDRMQRFAMQAGIHMRM